MMPGQPMAWAEGLPARRPAWPVAGLVLLAHLLLLMLIQQGWRETRVRPEQAAGTAPPDIVWLTVAPPQVPGPRTEPPATTALATAPTTALPERRPRRDTQPVTRPTAVSPATAPEAIGVAPLEPAPPPGAAPAAVGAGLPGARAEPVLAAASSAASSPRPLDTRASRDTLQALARRESWAERQAKATGIGPAATAEERRAQAIAATAPGDCLKGEYFGGGMGLLSLPFLAAAAVRGQCRD
jgi:hypothetical protein